MKILVFQIKMIGDVLASTVICQAIKQENAKYIVHYVIDKKTFAVVDNNPFIDKIIYFDEIKYKGIKGMIAFGKELKKEKYDVVIDAYGKWQSLIPAYFSNAAMRVGTYKWYAKFFLTHTVIPETACEGTANAFRLLLASTALKKEIKNIYPKLYLSSKEEIQAKDMINSIRANYPNKKIVMISLLGSATNKSLPKEYMAEVLNIISYSKKVIMVFNYMPNQKEQADAIYTASSKETQAYIVKDFYTNSLRSFICALSECDALIGNEGGATNMAKALNVPTFTIYAPWINRNSWNIFETTGLHEIVHLLDYKPELYNNKHPKNFKEKSLEWYKLLKPNLFKEKLNNFIYRITN